MAHARPPTSSPPARRTRSAVADALRRRILAGRYAAGERLPTCEAFADELGASYVTVVRGMDQLRGEGFIRAHRGRGTFVVEHPPHLYECALILPGQPGSGPGDGSRFWWALSEEARRGCERFAPWRVRAWKGVEPHEENEPYQSLVHAVRNDSLAGLMFPFGPEVYAGTPLVDHPGVGRVTVAWMPSSLPGFSAVHLDTVSFLDRALDAVVKDGRRRAAILMPPGLFDGRPEPAISVADRVRRHGLETRPYWLLPVSPLAATTIRPCVHLMMARPPDERPDALILLDDHMTESATAGVVDAGVSVPRDLSVVGYCNFPDRPPAVVPVRRLGFDMHELFEKMLEAIDRQRRDGSVTVTRIAPVFEEELESGTPGGKS